MLRYVTTKEESILELHRLSERTHRATATQINASERVYFVGVTRAEKIMFRLRAKAACEYAKELNPELSTWYQSKVTKASSYVGRVLLVAKGAKEPE